MTVAGRSRVGRESRVQDETIAVRRRDYPVGIPNVQVRPARVRRDGARWPPDREIGRGLPPAVARAGGRHQLEFADRSAVACPPVARVGRGDVEMPRRPKRSASRSASRRDRAARPQARGRRRSRRPDPVASPGCGRSAPVPDRQEDVAARGQVVDLPVVIPAVRVRIGAHHLGVRGDGAHVSLRLVVAE